MARIVGLRPGVDLGPWCTALDPTVSIHDVALLVSSSLLALVTLLQRLRDLGVPLSDYLTGVAAALGAL